MAVFFYTLSVTVLKNPAQKEFLYYARIAVCIVVPQQTSPNIIIDVTNNLFIHAPIKSAVILSQKIIPFSDLILKQQPLID